jgi:pimeloyl-ACP methyl ester carboxylesterase
MPELEGVEHRHLDLPTGVHAHVVLAGPQDAPPVLALHGWPQHWWMWRKVIPLLSDDFRVIAPDMRGFGWSGWPADNSFAKRRLADDALAVLDALGVDRAYVLGHDWGAWTTLLLGLDAPTRVRALVAIGVGHPWHPNAVALREGWRMLYQVPLSTPVVGERLVQEGTLVRKMLRAGWGARETWDQSAADHFAEVVSQPEQARATHRLYRSFLFGEVAEGPKMARQRLGMPARLVAGTREFFLPIAQGFERAGDDASFAVVEGAGHFVPEERPAAVAEHARELFARA